MPMVSHGFMDHHGPNPRSVGPEPNTAPTGAQALDADGGSLPFAATEALHQLGAHDGVGTTLQGQTRMCS